MYHAACDMLAGCCPRAAAVLEEAEPDALAYLDFPPTHWKRLRTNNVQERTNREIKRRSRVVQVFPSTGSLVRLAGAVMCEQDECVPSSKNRQIRLSNFDTLMLTASGRAGAVAAGPPAA